MCYYKRINHKNNNTYVKFKMIYCNSDFTHSLIPWFVRLTTRKQQKKYYNIKKCKTLFSIRN